METNITMSEFYKKYQTETLSILDVREDYEFQMGHVPTAKKFAIKHF